MDAKVLIVQVVALGACLWMESLVPLFMDRQGRMLHAVRNIAIGLVNGLVLTLGFSGLVISAAQWGNIHQLGLVYRLDLPPDAKRLAGFLAFDLWMYLWHRGNHTIPLLWRFHKVHHTDSALDCSSAVRFHLGEMLLSTALRLAVIPLLVIPLKDLVLYELILEPVIILHHSNIALPERWDRIMRLLVVSPNMHRVHHSNIPTETNSNYASIFSFWDRLCGTYVKRNVPSIRFGLKEFQDPRWQTFRGMLLTPAVSVPAPGNTAL